MRRLRLNVWGGALALWQEGRRSHWIDLFLVLAVAGLFYWMIFFARESLADKPARAVTIDLSLSALPGYSLRSLARGLIAYLFSLVFSLIYGYWAAKDKRAERVLIPLLDILQSIPVLGFMPGLILGLVALFPSTNFGLELASILMIFSGQVWNMTFSFYHSLTSMPHDLGEVASMYHFSPWKRFRLLELPFATMGLVWNSIMSMAGGWFFLTVCETFQVGNFDFRLPGLGSYMSAAVAAENWRAMSMAILAMIVMIVSLDQLLWRPIVVWAQKYNMEEGSGSDSIRATSWFLDLLHDSRILNSVVRQRRRRKRLDALNEIRHQKYALSQKGISLDMVSLPRGRGIGYAAHTNDSVPRTIRSRLVAFIPLCIFVLLANLLCFAAWKLILLMRGVEFSMWQMIFLAAGATLLRVLLCVFLATLWTVPTALLITRSPKLSQYAQPVLQVIASFPAPMIYPLLAGMIIAAGFGPSWIQWGSILLMLVGTQWYLLFNTIAGAMAIPSDLVEAARGFRISGWQRFRWLYVPSMLRFLVTGWVTTAGGAWNASIVTEYLQLGGDTYQAFGLGSMIFTATETSNFPLLTASVVVMALLVVLFNHFVWGALHRLAETKYAMDK